MLIPTAWDCVSWQQVGRGSGGASDSGLVRLPFPPLPCSLMLVVDLL